MHPRFAFYPVEEEKPNKKNRAIFLLVGVPSLIGAIIVANAAIMTVGLTMWLVGNNQ